MEGIIKWYYYGNEKTFVTGTLEDVLEAAVGMMDNGTEILEVKYGSNVYGVHNLKWYKENKQEALSKWLG